VDGTVRYVVPAHHERLLGSGHLAALIHNLGARCSASRPGRLTLRAPRYSLNMWFRGPQSRYGSFVTQKQYTVFHMPGFESHIQAVEQSLYRLHHSGAGIPKRYFY
jgi:hypothetical protein